MAKPKAKKVIRVEDLKVSRGGAIHVKGGGTKKVSPTPTPTPS